MENISLNNIKILPNHWRVFWGTFAAVFIMVMLQHFGVRPIKIIFPIPETVDIFDKVLPKLEQKANTYKLKKPIGSPVGLAYASESFDNASSYAVVDFTTGDVIKEKNIDKRLPIASLTKIMTAIVTLDLASPDELFSITEKAAGEEPTKIGVVPGEKMSVSELMNAMLLTSANDAAEALRDGVDAKYKSNIFIRAMNEKAKIIGLKNTNFTNPQGFDSPNHYSTTQDLAILSHYAFSNYPELSEIVRKEYEFLPKSQNHKQFDLYNWNGLIGVYPGALGIKIGNTDAAGKTTIVLSRRSGKMLLAVVLGASDIVERDLWAAQLLDAGFIKTLNLLPADITREKLLQKYKTWNI